MREVLLIAVAGALGTVSRYLVSNLAVRMWGGSFPHGTLAVNVVGCLLIGFLMHVGLHTDLFSPTSRLVFTVGFLGAFTTFSTFSYEATGYITRGAWGMAVLVISIHIILGVSAVLAGAALGRVTSG